MLQTALRHAQLTEANLMAEQQTLSTIALSGALILARMAYHVQSRVPEGTIQPYRELAHAMLDEALAEVELMFTQCEGHA